MKQEINVIGAGLAGCEAAYQAASRGFRVRLFEMKPLKMSKAHSNVNFAELVCSNSLKGMGETNASGLLKIEMETMGSIVIEAARATRVEAGGALAVDRDGFSQYITDKIKQHHNIETICRQIDRIPDEGIWIVATGPLTEGALYNHILEKTGSENLFFFDAAAPVVRSDSIDMGIAFMASRYGKGGDDYINCPMNEKQYMDFVEFLLGAERVNPRGFENKKVFEGCMPVEVMASRGFDTLRFGPMKPVGIIDPATGKRPHAVVQLRAENKDGTLYNLVGFQTSLKFDEQRKMVSMIPGLYDAVIERFGVMHRNSYLNSPELLDNRLSLKNDHRIFFAGQLTGVEGYLESAATGILAGIYASLHASGLDMPEPDSQTMTGALVNHISNGSVSKFQPMNANFGIMTGPSEFIRDKRLRKEKMAATAIETINDFKKRINEAFCT